MIHRYIVIGMYVFNITYCVVKALTATKGDSSLYFNAICGWTCALLNYISC